MTRQQPIVITARTVCAAVKTAVMVLGYLGVAAGVAALYATTEDAPPLALALVAATLGGTATLPGIPAGARGAMLGFAAWLGVCAVVCGLVGMRFPLLETGRAFDYWMVEIFIRTLVGGVAFGTVLCGILALCAAAIHGLFRMFLASCDETSSSAALRGMRDTLGRQPNDR